MSVIAPNTTVKLLQGCHIDSDYNHTIFFPDVNAQTTFMQSLVAVNYGTYNNQMYQRVGDGVIRLQVLADNIYGCNYMMFQNTNYGTKWFYAFIDNIKYVNDNATEIHYTIDDMQTWYFDYELGSCFVEREHVVSDRIGENIVAEPFPNLPVICDSETVIAYTKPDTEPELQFTCLILYTPQTDAVPIGQQILTTTVTGHPSNSAVEDPTQYSNWHDDSTGKTYVYTFVESENDMAGVVANKLYAGYNYLTFPLYFRNETINGVTKNLSDVTKINVIRAIQTLISAKCTIIDMYQLPTQMIKVTNGQLDFENALLTSSTQKKTVKQSYSFKQNIVDATTANQTITYEPKNKKLYTYPYKYLVVSNHNGQEKTYRWEFFKTAGSTNTGHNRTASATFYLQSAPLPKPTLSLVPYTYRNITYDYGNALEISDFLKTTWSTDSYTEWKAQSGTAVGISAITQMLGVIAGAAALAAPSGKSSEDSSGGKWHGLSTATKIGAITGTASIIGNVVGQTVRAQNTPDKTNGTQSSTLDLVRNYFGYSAYQMSITAENAKIVDEYFNMFGYAVNSVKVPNVKNDFIIQNGGLRAHWNYIKTNGCIIHGKISSPTNGLPSEAESNIARIYDKGITFWMDGSEVGHYGLDNNEHYIPE